MIHFNQTEEIIRNADDVCYAMNVTIKAYGSPLVRKTRTYNLNSTDDTTATHLVPDWDNCTEIGSDTKQILIPANKQTNTVSAGRRATPTDYDTLRPEWYAIANEDDDIIKIKQDFLTNLGPTYDGYVTS